MKQFDDINSSLHDLNVGKIENLIAEPIEKMEGNNNDETNNPSESNESGEEVSPEVFNKNIHDVLMLIKQIMKNENKS